jgi:UDP-2,3-diacylglucosamine pyrophosphatase LpxH
MGKADDIAKGLEKAFTSQERVLGLSVELGQARYIVFSDLHKGQRDRADDFLKCERAYNAALGYYLAKGYTLFAVGDIEELWECRPKNVMAKYKYNLELEGRFHQDQRYYRFYGNHDDDWASQGAVEKFLQPLYEGRPLTVYEAARIQVSDAGQLLGTLFLLHGHQGTSFSDRHRKISRFFVRFVWRPIQRLIRVSTTTPATNWELREEHELAMHQWASSRSKLVLVAGHTHRPVLMSKSHSGEVLEQLQGATDALVREPQSMALQERVAKLQAELEWIRAQGPTPPEAVELLVKPQKCCYFNAGCCCYPDGDITGLEISDGELKLVRWPNDADRPEPQVLGQRVPLRKLFQDLT